LTEKTYAMKVEEYTNNTYEIVVEVYENLTLIESISIPKDAVTRVFTKIVSLEHKGMTEKSRFKNILKGGKNEKENYL